MRNDLRTGLEELTLNEQVPEHPAELELLRAKLTHTVNVQPSEHPLGRYTCGVHAFYLTEDPAYLSVAEWGLGRTYAGAEFIRYLLESKSLNPKQCDQAVSGDIIIYFEREEFRHIGRFVSPGRVESKWGKGQLYEHGIWEVPKNYGDNVKCFEGTDDDQSWSLFQSYAESEGFEFGPPPHI